MLKVWCATISRIKRSPMLPLPVVHIVNMLPGQRNSLSASALYRNGKNLRTTSGHYSIAVWQNAASWRPCIYAKQAMLRRSKRCTPPHYGRKEHTGNAKLLAAGRAGGQEGLLLGRKVNLMRRTTILPLFFVALFTTSFAVHGSPGPGQIDATAGCAAFRKAGDGQPYVMLYYAVNPGTLHYQKDSAGRLVATVHVQYRISADTGVVRKESFYLKTKPYLPREEAVPKFLEQEQVSVPEGHYTAELQLSEDAWPAARFYYRDTVVVAGGCPQYSSLLLLDTAIASVKPSPFLRHGWQLLPRPLAFYDEGQQTVQTYFELYGQPCLKTAGFPMRQTLFISKERGVADMPQHLLTDTITALADEQYFLRNLSTATLPSGNYWLNVSLSAASGAEIAKSALFFQTINKNPLPEAPIAGSIADTSALTQLSKGQLLDLGKTFVARFDMAQMRAILKMLRPAADAADEAAIHGFLNRPDEFYMRFFIYNHFAQRNRADPGKAWKDFADVVREVNRRFSSGALWVMKRSAGLFTCVMASRTRK